MQAMEAEQVVEERVTEDDIEVVLMFQEQQIIG